MFLENFTLLYVEDDPITQELTVEILEPFVKTLYVANDGMQGLELYKENKPDIVLTDINMPHMNGLEMSEKIKQTNPHQSIAMVTAFSELDYLKTAVNLGIDKYIMKPITDLELFFNALESIAKVLSQDKEIKELEYAMQMQSKLDAISDMIGNIAHQWRQPLTAITTSANNLLLNITLDKKINNIDIEKHVKMVTQNTEQLSETITNFRDFFKDTKGKQISFNIKDAILKTIEVFKDSFLNSSIEIILDLEDIRIVQNENQLIQVFINILQNAKDAFHKNDLSAPRILFIKCKLENNSTQISFLDNASGIDDEIMDKIFEPYFTTKHESSGVGISLYMSSQIIIKHFNGTLKASNKTFIHNETSYTGALFTINI